VFIGLGWLHVDRGNFGVGSLRREPDMDLVGGGGVEEGFNVEVV